MERGLGMNKIPLGLFLVGAVVGAIGWVLFLRMAIELNKILPPDSALSAAWFALMVVAGAFWASAVVLELVRTSSSL